MSKGSHKQTAKPGESWGFAGDANRWTGRVGPPVAGSEDSWICWRDDRGRAVWERRPGHPSEKEQELEEAGWEEYTVLITGETERQRCWANQTTKEVRWTEPGYNDPSSPLYAPYAQDGHRRSATPYFNIGRWSPQAPEVLSHKEQTLLSPLQLPSHSVSDSYASDYDYDSDRVDLSPSLGERTLIDTLPAEIVDMIAAMVWRGGPAEFSSVKMRLTAPYHQLLINSKCISHRDTDAGDSWDAKLHEKWKDWGVRHVHYEFGDEFVPHALRLAYLRIRNQSWSHELSNKDSSDSTPGRLQVAQLLRLTAVPDLKPIPISDFISQASALIALSLDGTLSARLPRILAYLPRGDEQLQELSLELSTACRAAQIGTLRRVRNLSTLRVRGPPGLGAASLLVLDDEVYSLLLFAIWRLPNLQHLDLDLRNVVVPDLWIKHQAPPPRSPLRRLVISVSEGLAFAFACALACAVSSTLEIFSFSAGARQSVWRQNVLFLEKPTFSRLRLLRLENVGFERNGGRAIEAGAAFFVAITNILPRSQDLECLEVSAGMDMYEHQADVFAELVNARPTLKEVSLRTTCTPSARHSLLGLRKDLAGRGVRTEHWLLSAPVRLQQPLPMAYVPLPAGLSFRKRPATGGIESEAPRPRHARRSASIAVAATEQAARTAESPETDATVPAVPPVPSAHTG